jgi:hypothetical protein
MMTKTNTNATVAIFALIGISLLSTRAAQAQANLAFSGGSGTPLTITLLSPVTYNITSSSSSGFFFVFKDIGNIFTNSFPVVTSTITYIINGGAAQNSITKLNSGLGGPPSALNPTDVYCLGVLPNVNVGDTVFLSAGAFTTTSNIAASAPANGLYPTFVLGPGITNIGNGVSGVAAPEPGTLALITLVSGSMGLITRLRRNKRTI